ncbi:MAG: D-hexose-6-phosphate mutarotase [Gallionellaceae bacterium]|nr:D-hexose-6-phosphate mutarotase [Gallionellaceae bacterium]
MNPDDLNSRYGLPTLKFVEGAGGLVFAEVDNAGGVATICLQGAHIVTWRPKAQAEAVVWVSEAAKYGPGKSIRGGVPVCWPWFGPHATEKAFPGHGFARTMMWQVTGSETQTSGATRIWLMLMPNDQTHAQFAKACRAELIVTVGATLQVDLMTSNLDTEAVEIGEALHTYLRIGDIGTARVTGLDGSSYVDKVDGGQRKQQSGAIAFSGEVDRVYVDTESECVIEDPDLKRRIRIAKTGSRSTVVWTPWLEKAEKMADFGPGKHNQGGWREMVCVESGNALDNVVSVPAGESHVLSVVYSAEAM